MLLARRFEPVLGLMLGNRRAESSLARQRTLFQLFRQLRLVGHRVKAIGGHRTRMPFGKKTKLEQNNTEKSKYTNEIGVCVSLLESIPDLKGKVITADAMLTQRKIAQQVLDQEADYMFILKDNQKNLNEAVSYYFTQLRL